MGDMADMINEEVPPDVVYEFPPCVCFSKDSRHNKVRTKIVGTTFDGRQELISELVINQELKLEREPNNKFDKYAVAVKTQSGKHLGYLKKQLAPEFSEALSRGVGYDVQVMEITGGGKDRCYGCNIEIIKKESKDNE